MMMSFQFFAWVASILFAVESIQTKFVSKHKIQNPWLFNFVWLLFLLFFNTIVCLSSGAGIPDAWGNIILVGLFFAIGLNLFTLANYRMDVSILTPLSNSQTIFAIILGMLFLNEHLSAWQSGLIGIMIVAGIIVTIDEKFSIKSFFNKGVTMCLASMLSFALMAMFFKKASTEVPFWTLNLWYFFSATVFTTLTIPFFKKDIKTLDKNQLSNVSLLALVGVLANLAANKAYTANISISTAITSIPLSMAIVILIAPFFPKLSEHHTWKVYLVRIIAAVVLVYAGLKL